MERIPQSVTKRVPLKAYLAADQSAATGKTIAVVISKNGAAFANPSGGATNATEIGSGWYYVDLSTTDTGTAGPLLVRGTAATIDDVEVRLTVANAHNAGFDGVPDAVAAATGGLATVDSSNAVKVQSGTGANQISLSSGLVALSPAGIQAIWDALTSALTTVGSIGKRLVDYLTGDIYARLGAPAGASVSADIAAAKSDTAAIKLKTDNLPGSPAAVGSAMTLTSGERTSIADALLARALAAESYAADGAVPTLSQVLYMMWSAIGDFSISGTTLSCKKLDGSSEAMTFTLDSATAPTSRTRAT